MFLIRAARAFLCDHIYPLQDYFLFCLICQDENSSQKLGCSVTIIIINNGLCCVSDFDEALLKAAEEALPIPIGAGIAGHVALTKSGLRILDAYRVSVHFCVIPNGNAADCILLKVWGRGIRRSGTLGILDRNS